MSSGVTVFCTVLVLLFVQLTSLQVAIDCQDEEERCDEWASFGHCLREKEWMEISCRKSCGLCTSAASHPYPKTTLLTETVTTTTTPTSASLTATPTTTTGSTPKTTIINLTTTISNGVFGDWTDWSTCRHRRQMRTRSCGDPTGSKCRGSRFMTRLCLPSVSLTTENFPSV